VFLFGIIVLSGCLTMRSYTNEEPRKDLDVSGNQGCLSGECEQEVRENKLGDTRAVSVVEVEFGPRELINGIVEGKVREEVIGTEQKEEGIVLANRKMIEAVSQEDLMEGVKAETQYYVVKDNDTLQKISRKFYGTTKQWNFIYETNTDVLKSPDRLYPGTQIKIVPLD